jgi:hypothetical protein
MRQRWHGMFMPQPIIGNERLHEIINDNEVMVLNFDIFKI